MERYSRWHLTQFSGDKEVARSHLPYARKLLGYVDEQRRLNPGAPTQILRRTLQDGTEIIAEFIDDVPRIRINALGRKSTGLAQLGGFVTWPTDAAGETALPESVRIVLAGARYRGIREPEYTNIFPDGLDRAGNVDWHGKRGWVLSWYGPRTRYFESAPELKPYVFAKGLPIVDVRDHIDTDAVVLGACVVTAPTGVWLLLVTEEFTFGRWEDVSVLRLRDADTGAAPTPTTARYDVDPDSFEFLDSRDNDDIVVMRHPWFFNPDGSEGRMLTQIDTGELGERIIRLVESTDFACGFAVERDLVVHTIATETDSSGFTSATFGTYYGRARAQRRLPLTGMAGLPTGTPPLGASPVSVSGAFTIASDSGGNYGAATMPTGMREFEYARDLTCGGDWQPIAVDYTADGSVVYAYGRYRTLTNRRSGSFAPDPSVGIGDLNPVYLDNSFTATATPFDGESEPFWVYGISYNLGQGIDPVHTKMLAERTETTTEITAGIKLGAVEVIATSTLESTENGSSEWQAAGGSTSTAPSSTAFFDPFDGNTATGDVHGTGAIGDSSVDIIGESERTEVDQLLYVVHLDLRYGALFTVTQIDTLHETIEYNHHWSSFSGANPTGTMETTTNTHNTRVWRVQGHVHGRPVPNLARDIVTQDELDTDVVTSAAPIYSSGLYGSVIAVCGWYPLDDDPGVHGNTFAPALPLANTWLPVERNFDWSDDDMAVPALYTPTHDFTVKPEYLYAVTHVRDPVLHQFLLSWHIEVEASYPDVVGYSFGLITDPKRCKVKWHYDADNIGHCGSWAYYKGEWAFSMSLPAPAPDAEPFTLVSLCRIGSIAPRALSEAEIDEGTVEHFYPIWVLPDSGRFLQPESV